MVKYLTGRPNVCYSMSMVVFVLRYPDLAEMKDNMVADQFAWSYAFQKTQILGAIKSLNFL